VRVRKLEPLRLSVAPEVMVTAVNVTELPRFSIFAAEPFPIEIVPRSLLVALPVIVTVPALLPNVRVPDPFVIVALVVITKFPFILQLLAGRVYVPVPPKVRLLKAVAVTVAVEPVYWTVAGEVKVPEIERGVPVPVNVRLIPSPDAPKVAPLVIVTAVNFTDPPRLTTFATEPLPTEIVPRSLLIALPVMLTVLAVFPKVIVPEPLVTVAPVVTNRLPSMLHPVSGNVYVPVPPRVKL
jgi:hypothetical protein